MDRLDVHVDLKPELYVDNHISIRGKQMQTKLVLPLYNTIPVIQPDYREYERIEKSLEFYGEYKDLCLNLKLPEWQEKFHTDPEVCSLFSFLHTCINVFVHDFI